MIKAVLNRVRVWLPNGSGTPWPSGLKGQDVQAISVILIIFWVFDFEVFDRVRESLRIRDPLGGNAFDWTRAHDDLLFSSLYTIAFVGIIYVILRRRRLDWQVLGLASPTKQVFIFGTCTGFVKFGLATLLSWVTIFLLPDILPSNENVFVQLPSDWFSVLIDLLTSVFAIPIAEEVYFRGVLFTWMIRKRSRFHAYAATSVIFAVYHLRFDALDFAELLVAGLIYGWVYERTRSLWASIAAHGSSNLAVTVYNYASFA